MIEKVKLKANERLEEKGYYLKGHLGQNELTIYEIKNEKNEITGKVEYRETVINRKQLKHRKSLRQTDNNGKVIYSYSEDEE